MKLPFTIHDSRFTIWKKSPDPAVAGRRAGAAGNRKSPFVNRKSRQGIALVITLILLSVTLVMAIAFLAISRREAGAVTTSTDSVTARLAADAALANAQAQIIASVLATTNPYNAGLLVSTNFVNGYGFVPGVANPTNVNYDYLSGGGALGQNQFVQNVANLLYLPRAPVFVPNPTNPAGPSDFRFYLDLDRNGQFEDSGLVNETNSANQATGNLVSETGDPQWVGVLERPDATHGPNNKFVSRYAFVAVPADGSLDLNAIHNQTLNISLGRNDGFFRNEGIGSWELNLAAFLADLNTNEWLAVAPPNNTYYGYYQPAGSANSGHAFEDALSLLSFRYSFNYNNQGLLAPNFYNALVNFGVDGYTVGNLMTGTVLPIVNKPIGLSLAPWAGSDNTNRYFALASDLFNPAKVEQGVKPPGFIERLNQADNNVSTYDRYTFYRMLAQMGTDSAPAQNQINVNYSNAAALYDKNGILTNVVYFANAETNLVPWQPLQFFTITADRLLHQYSTTWFQSDPSNYLAAYYNIHTNYYYTDASGIIHTNDASGVGLTSMLGVPNVLGLTYDRIPSFGITNIPVLENGQFVYSPAVQRVLQMVANIYDATTNQAAYLGKDFPSVFRPVLYATNNLPGLTNVTIVGFQYIASVTSASPGLTGYPPPLNPPDLILGDVYSLKLGFTPPRPGLSPSDPLNTYGNVYGVPWIIGAKKGLPNFNEFSMQDVVKVTRKLLMTRPNTNSLPTATNQMYVFSITNSLGVEFWNPYTNAYSNLSRQIQVVVNDQLSMRMQLTNGTVLYADGKTLSQNYPLGAQTNFNIWPAGAFLVPYSTNFPILMDSAYQFAAPQQFYFVGDNPNPTSYRQTIPSFPALPQIELNVTNKLQAFILDTDANGLLRVIDYVHFTGPGTSRDLSAEFQNTNTTVVGGGTGPYYTNLVWSTALDNTGMPLGVATQVGISSGAIGLNTVFWKDPNVHAEIDGFRHFLNPLNASLYGTQNNFMYATNLAVQVPYTPTAITYEYDTFQANDPLVHYLKSDLGYFGNDPADPNSLLQTGVHAQNLTIPKYAVLPNLGKVNARYMPWGKTFPTGERDAFGQAVSDATVDKSLYNLSFKDPLMVRADNWDFPTNKLPTVGWLGRVHRGTPWQTVYMKATDILPEPNPANPNLGNAGTNTWAVLMSDGNHYDAVNAAPIQDRLLFDNFSTALNDNAARGQLSVNQNHLAAWSAVLSGAVALTNATAFPQFQPLVNSSLTINPAGPAGLNSVLGQIVTNINYQRANFKNPDGLRGVFEHVGDVLSTPQLTEKSPFLNANNTTAGGQQLQYGINDEMYEWLPQQTLSLLRVVGTPQSPMRYVIYSYGQTLKPAPNGVVTGGPNLANGTSPFGMVTNYQVVAESATRAVVRMSPVITTNSNGTLNTNYSTAIEQFNVLPPD